MSTEREPEGQGGSGGPAGPGSTESRRLARELSALRERTGLSLAALSERTTASKSSWHRYLRGTKLPPAGLVRELCALAEEPPGRLLALWELAQAAQSRGAGPSAPPVTEPAGAGGRRASGPRTRPGARRSWWSVPVTHWRSWSRSLRAVSAALTAVTVLAVAVAAWPVARGGAPPPAAVPEPSGEVSHQRPGCSGDECAGRDADQQGCTLPGSGLLTLVNHRQPDGTGLEIRYSEVCRAGWGRTWSGEVGDRVEVTGPDGQSQRALVRDVHDAGGYVYTAMVAGSPEELTACLFAEDEDEPEICLTGS